MSEELKTPETPVAETLIDNRRAVIENLVIEENGRVPEPEVTEETPAIPVPEEKTEKPVDPVQRIKDSVQKRIDKVVAQKKSVEEELAEARAEIERLKTSPKQEQQPASDPNAKPTVEQVEAYIIKMKKEGNVEEEVAATRYLIKLEKEQALKEVETQQTESKKQAEAQSTQQLAEWSDLQRDYIVYTPDGKPDTSSDLTLENQKGLLYRTALSLYNDKELHASHYDDTNVIRGFRRAVADAYREIHQQGLVAPKGQVTPRNPRQVLADPSTVSSEDVTPAQPQVLSDADKVREEIKNRNKNRFLRKIPQ